ncbi:SPFH domain-containing protein [Lewinella sp. LCG006]|uniref:SPFH domain-containing protein n=1 Tax=Lewinella sp. LCG006 TaxID=3231911 RepID=UPI0034600A8A
MFGFKHIQFDAMTYVMHYKNGTIHQEGRGLSFFYFKPNSSIVAIPMGGNDLPFVFKEMSADYQTVTIQGQISYQISEPKKLADVLDFTVNEEGRYKKNDLEKLNQRTINEAQTAVTAFIHGLSLQDALGAASTLEQRILSGLQSSPMIGMLGIEIMGVNILAVRAVPEMTRALETSTREKLQQEADQAIYERRNFAVEQERKIKESELNTEIAIEEKQKQITEKKMESEVLRQENKRKLNEMVMAGNIELEQQRQSLVEQKAINDRKLADTKAYVVDTTLKPYKDLDWKMITALSNNPDPRLNMTLAFRELAENAGKIGNLNISPDLLENLLEKGR